MPADASWSDYPYRVQSQRLVTPVIREVHLFPDDHVLTYQAGQYVLLGDRDGEVPQRSYSLANAPRPDGRVSLLVTHVEGGPTSSWVHERLHPGSPVLLSGPHGTFVPDPHRTGPVLLLAAGSGLAPARALAEALQRERPPRPVTLFFSARTGQDTIEHERWQTEARTSRNFRYLVALTREPGVADSRRIPERLADALGDLTGWEVFVSGPPGFVIGCSTAARVLGAEPEAIHLEAFFSDPQPWTTRAPLPAPSGP